MPNKVWGRDHLEGAWAELRWRQYAKSPELFFEECLWIPSQEADRAVNGRVRFELFDYQREDLETFLTNRFVIVLKGRQLGLSTLVGGLALHRCLFNPGTVILWVSNNQDNANKAVKTLNVMWQFLPEWVRDRAPKQTSKAVGSPEWEFPDGMTSRIRTFAGTATATASETATIVILDEFALVDPNLQPQLLASASPTTDAGGSLWIISTARGAHNQFAVTFNKARRDESQFVPIFHPWMLSRFINPQADKMHGCGLCGGSGVTYTEPNGDQARRQVLCPECVDTTIYEVKAREFDDRPWLVHSEYPATVEEAFRESGNPVFTDLPLEEDCETTWLRGAILEGSDGPEFVEDEYGALRIHPEALDGGKPEAWRPYVAFIDPSEGVGGDYIAAHFLTWDDDGLPTIVAWWHANDIKAIDAARELGTAGRFFRGSNGDALIAVETTGGWGGSMLSELSAHMNYSNLYVHVPADQRRRKLGTKLGFPMSQGRRPQVIDRLLLNMTADRQIGRIYPELRMELATFVRNEKGRLEADVGQHDDLVMSLAGALWVLTEETTATEPPSNEGGSRPEHRTKLKAIWQKVDHARLLEQQRIAEEERRIQRRAEAGNRIRARRERRNSRELVRR